MAAQTEFQSKLDQTKKQQRTLDALRYERQSLATTLDEYRCFSTPHLVRLARGQRTDGEDNTVLADFLQADLSDPDKRQHITARLHQEINARGSLERDLKLHQKELTAVQQELLAKRQFLHSLVDQLASVERAFVSLQKFMTAHSDNESAPALALMGTDRQARLEAAQALPSCLYTIFQQLQQFVDDGEEGMSVDVAGDDDHRQVVLHLTMPDVVKNNTNKTKTKRLAVHFHSSDRPCAVTAEASGAGSTLNQDVVLRELFPGDDPSPIESLPGRPYQWCNYLAGLHRVGNQTTGQPSGHSTRVIVRELQRRLRANATFKHILYSLERNHVPVVPGDDEAEPLQAKLNSFQASAGGSNDDALERAYAVELRKGTASITMQVTLNIASYPVKLPVWKLQLENELYNDQLAALERKVNAELVEELISSDREESYLEWILVLQLRTIMQTWAATVGDGKRVGRVRLVAEERPAKRSRAT